ncbi:alpha/beta hydrolase [Microbacterium lushaniae]|nr:alpha/beta hydrolase [Microbacterium lushaniae]KAA9158190.1 alpha/beta hydrolase [Microbacterium lushaniae]
MRGSHPTAEPRTRSRGEHLMIDHNGLEPGIRAWLARIDDLQVQFPLAAPGDFPARRERDRRLSDALAAEFVAPPDPRAELSDIEFPGVDGHAPLFARRIRPRGVDGPLPTQLFLHGGGFVSGTARELLNDAVMSERSAAAGVQIISLDYRLAPEHPYPAAVEDALSVLQALYTAADPWGVDPWRLGIGGSSAGGHIAAVTALRVRDACRADPTCPSLAHMLLEVPALDLSVDWPSMRAFAEPAELQAALAVAAVYRGAEDPGPYLNPSRVGDLSGLPRTLVMTAQFDALRDAAEAFVHRITHAGVDGRLRRGAGQLHGTSGLTAAVASSRDWQEAAIEELRTGLVGFDSATAADEEDPSHTADASPLR